MRTPLSERTGVLPAPRQSESLNVSAKENTR
jgi:hypothetical protein